MLEIWNDSSILPPPVLTFTCNYTFDTDGLLYTCNEIIRVLSKQSPLHKEGAILSRLQYKFDKKFRNDIGYRNFKKVNTALRKYLALNFLKDVQNFVSVLASDDTGEHYLPSRQMLEYILVRLQTFSKIMMRICICSKQTAIFYLDRIKRGESHWMSLIPYAALSRTWSISMVLISHACNWYNKLHTYLDKLQLKGIPFLPTGHCLPTDLNEWLDLKNIDEIGKYEWSENKAVQVLPILSENEDADGAFDIFKYVTDINDEQDVIPEVQLTENTEIIVPTAFHQRVAQSIDQGQKVSRESLKISSIKSNMDHGKPISRLKAQNTNQPVSKLDADITSKPKKLKLLADDNFSTNANETKRTDVSNETSNLNAKMSNQSSISNQLQSLKMFKDSKKEIQRNSKHCMEIVTSSDSLKKFLKTEEKFRIEDNADSLTSHLSFMQWQALKGSLSKLSDLLANNRKIQRKFEKIWKEKCVDYL